MALIKRFTPGGNLFPDGSSTFAVLREFFEELAKNRDERDTTLRTEASQAILDAEAEAAFRDVIARGIICRGDSQTAGQGGGGVTYPLELQKMIPAIPVEKRGYPGETPKAISTRQGSTPLLVTVTSGTIPASGSTAITIKDATTDAKLYYGAFAAGGVPDGRASIGTLAGVRGELRGDPNAGYTFARAAAGNEIPAAGEIPFVDEWESVRRDWNQIVMIGRNQSTTTDVAQYAQRIVDFQTAGDYLSLSVLTASNETSGTAGYNQVTAKNAALSDAHGTNYLDVRRYMIDHGLDYVGITPTTADTTAINGDTIPPSLMDPDLVHPNADGYRVIAKCVHDKIVELGWTGIRPMAAPALLGVDDYDYRFIANRAQVNETEPVLSLTSTTTGGVLAQPITGAAPLLNAAGGDAFLNFDGTDDYMRVDGFSHSGPLTVVMVARLNNVAGVSKTTVRLSTSTGNPQAVSTVSSTSLATNHTVRGSATLSGPTVNLGDGKFHALGSVWNGATSVASIDDQSTTGDAGTVAAMNVFSLGDSGAGAGFADYDIAEVLVWRRALSPAELTTVYQGLRSTHPEILA